MALEFIPPAWAGILLILGVLGLVFKAKIAKKIASYVPLFPAQMVLIIAAVIGIVAGGVGWVTSTATGLTGVDVAMIGRPAELPAAKEIALSSCVYSSGTSVTGNATVRTDTVTNNRVYVDVDESAFLLDTNGQAAAEVNVSFTCTRVGATSEDGFVHIVVKGDEFRSETSTTDVSTYNIVSTTATPSDVWAGGYVQTLYVEDNAQATTSSTKEETYLTFGEGEKELDVYVMADVDPTAFQNLNNYSARNVNIYQRSEETGTDQILGSVIINKVP